MSRRSTSHQDMAIDVNELNEPVPRAVYGSCRLSLAAIKKGDLLAFSFSESRIIVDSGCRVPVLSIASNGARQKGLVQSGRGALPTATCRTAPKTQTQCGLERSGVLAPF